MLADRHVVGRVPATKSTMVLAKGCTSPPIRGNVRSSAKRPWCADLRPASGLWTFRPKKGAFPPAPQRGAAYQPRVQPWVDVAPHSCVLKERRIEIDWTHVLRPDSNRSFRQMRRSFRTRGDVRQGSQGVALGWYAVSLRDTGNVQSSTRDKTRASCPGLINI